jgi:DNA-3-methyladenine glycosylase II
MHSAGFQMAQPRVKKTKSIRTKPTEEFVARYLSSADPRLSLVIKGAGKLPEYYRQQTHFETISRIIVGQQLSYRAAESIWRSLKNRFPRWTPVVLAKASATDLRSAGLSAPKAAYIRGLSGRIVAGDLSLRGLGRLQEAKVLDRLGTIKGFGPWSMEMFLIFALGYPDVFSCGDAGLRRAISALYSIPSEKYEMHAAEIAKHWTPFRSYACRYLWLWLDSAAKC